MHSLKYLPKRRLNLTGSEFAVLPFWLVLLQLRHKIIRTKADMNREKELDSGYNQGLKYTAKTVLLVSIKVSNLKYTAKTVLLVSIKVSNPN